MRHLAFLFVVALSVTARAETQTVKQGRLRYALIATGSAPAHAELLRDAFARVLDYDTAVELLAADPDDGVIGYAVDTDAAYLRANDSWIALASSSGILGSNGGTLDNETNNVWTLAENSENATFTFGTDTVTLASGTSATFIITPALSVTGDLTLNGGVGALTFGAASSSTVVPDDSATALVMGSTGRLDLLGLDTQDDVEKVLIKGTTTATSFHVDVGDALFDEDVSVGNGLTVAEMTVGLDFNAFRVFDDPNALLPSAGATDDLGLVLGTPGTNAPSLQTEDLKAEAGNPTLNKALFQFPMPAQYLAGSTVSVVFSAGMITTIADDAATLDLECWVPDYANADGTVSTDLVAEAAQDMNSTTFANLSFTVDDDLTGHVLAAGSVVQCIVTTSVSDAATGTAVIAAVRAASVAITD